MGRTMPTDCERCDGVIDWGDFGPDPGDGQVGRTCRCEPTLLVWLREQYKDAKGRVATETEPEFSWGYFGRAMAFQEVARHHGWNLEAKP